MCRVGESPGGPQASARRVLAAVAHGGERPQCHVSTGRRYVGRRRGHQAVSRARALESQGHTPQQGAVTTLTRCQLPGARRLSPQGGHVAPLPVTVSQDCRLPGRAGVSVKHTCVHTGTLLSVLRVASVPGPGLQRCRGRGPRRGDFPPGSQALLQWQDHPSVHAPPSGRGRLPTPPPGSARL